MPVYGVACQFRTLRHGNRSNQWWVAQTSMDAAGAVGVNLAIATCTGMGATNRFYNVHVWEPGVDPNAFQNFPINYPGLVAAADPISGVICVKMALGVDSVSYPLAKYFRVCVNASEMAGITWTASYTAVLEQMRQDLIAYLPYICDKNGNPATGITLAPEQAFRQLSKRWYNRASV